MAFVLSALVSAVMNKLLDKAIEDIVTAFGVKSEMEKLKSSVENIRLVLVDAESKKIESKAIALFLAELREAMYDAEDLLDDFHAYRDKNELQKLKDKITRDKNKLQKTKDEINSTLERLNSQTSILQLLASQPNADKVCHHNNSRITETCSIQLDSDIVGLDDDAKKLVDLITQDNTRAHSVFAITGMGGIGKTTLARKIFNHKLIKDHFDKTIWICVSSSCSGEYLLKEVVRSIENNYNQSDVSINELSSNHYQSDVSINELSSNHYPIDVSINKFSFNYYQSDVSINELSFKVINVVNGKKVFIILDDIWDADLWENFLRIPLLVAGAKDSRILITTRNKEVAMKMNVVHVHPMTEMLPSDGWSMLCKIVFELEDNRDMSELEDVGKDIVKKCKHLPLAIKMVGRVLKMTDRTAAAWEKVLSSRTWSTCGLPEEILLTLLLSYEDLPSHLKRCFIYCSLFPQDYIFYRGELPYMWIAEGFIQKEEGLTMEESAEEYYNELLMRNILQVTSDHSDGNSKCKMHDLLHSLALFVSQNQYIYLDPKIFIGSSGLIKRRHLWFSEENMNVVPKETKGKEHVRTLMLSTNTKTIPDELLSGLKRLRVLYIKGTTIKTLPDCVGKMRQLRFLSISSSELDKLPDSIKNLKNLETLMIDSVSTSPSLPEGIVELENLRHLLMSDRPKDMPNGLNKLKNLRVLNCFVVNDRANMKELKDLSELTDLSIYHLERVANKKEAEEAAMKDKTSLKRLKLHCQPEAEVAAVEKKTSLKFPKLHRKTPDQTPRTSAIKKIEEVFEGIQIPQKLTELSIEGFFGKQFPAHMIGSHLLHVKSLKLERCVSVERVPSLGNMPKLETLHIKNLSKLQDFGSSFVGSSKFPKLQDFHLVGMKDLMKMFEVEEGAFPCLVNLFVSNCPKLTSLGEGLHHAKRLKKMTVREVSILESIKNLSSITELEISRNDNLKYVKDLPSLKKMDINDCFALEVVQEVRELSSLSISDENITSLPEWLKNTIGENAFPCLVNLHISDCPKLRSLGEGLQHAACLKKMTVRDARELASIENLSSITELEISRNDNLKYVRNLPSLKKMDINDCSSLGVVQEVRELSSLSISDANITSLPEWLKFTIFSEQWLPPVRESDQEFVRLTEEDWTVINKRVEIKINDVKVDSNSFRGADNDYMDVD